MERGNDKRKKDGEVTKRVRDRQAESKRDLEGGQEEEGR